MSKRVPSGSRASTESRLPLIKVTFCAHDKPGNVGGPVSWIRRLFPLLRERGIEPRCLFVLHHGNSGPALSSLVLSGFDCRWTTLDTTEDRIRWIIGDLEQDRPDIFVPNLVVAAYFAAQWARRAGISTVGVLHSDDSFYKALASEFVFTSEERRLDAIVCVSRQLENDMMSRTPRGTIVRRIPYGVPIPAAAVSRSESALRLAYVGRLAEKQKRITDVVRALGKAVREVPEVRATIYGDGPDRRKVRRLLDSEFANEDITLAGLVDSESIQQLMLAVDVVVLMSDYEGLPIALLEAMACGCVPVCLDARSGIRELVTHDVTGLIVPDGDAGFVEAIRRLSRDSQLLSRLSRGARERAAEFSTESSAGEWANLFAELRGKHAPAPISPLAMLSLPPVHPDLAIEDRRGFRPRFLSILASRFRRILRGLRHEFLS